MTNDNRKGEPMIQVEFIDHRGELMFKQAVPQDRLMEASIIALRAPRLAEEGDSYTAYFAYESSPTFRGARFRLVKMLPMDFVIQDGDAEASRAFIKHLNTQLDN